MRFFPKQTLKTKMPDEVEVFRNKKQLRLEAIELDRIVRKERSTNPNDFRVSFGTTYLLLVVCCCYLLLEQTVVNWEQAVKALTVR